jgi:hypothetical protein
MKDGSADAAVAAVCDRRVENDFDAHRAPLQGSPSSKNDFAIHDLVNILGAHRDATTKRQS